MSIDVGLGIFPKMESGERPFHEIVKARLDELGENAFSMSAKTGIAYDKFRNILRKDERRADAKLETAREICAALGLEFYIGPVRETEPVEHMTLDGADYAHIPLHDAMLAAGAGAFNGTEAVVDTLAFRRDWLQRMGVSASTARLARVCGDSMQPSLWHGDMILIDTRANEPAIRSRETRDQRRSPIYALIDNGEARVKRIERPSPDQMMLISDNPDYPPDLRQAADLKAMTIIGRVVWWGHTNKD